MLPELDNKKKSSEDKMGQVISVGVVLVGSGCRDKCVHNRFPPVFDSCVYMCVGVSYS